MKKLFVVLLLAGAAYYFLSPTNTQASVGRWVSDVVHGTTPVDVHDSSWTNPFLRKLKTLSPEKRKAELDKNAPRVTGRIIEHLVNRGLM